MGFVQVFLDPLAVDGVLAAVARERLHVPRRLLEAAQLLVAVADKHVLVVDMVAGQQQSQRSSERQAAVRTVGREPFVSVVRSHRRRQVFRVREHVQAQALVADAHLLRAHGDVFQTLRILRRQCQVSAYDARFLLRAC